MLLLIFSVSDILATHIELPEYIGKYAKNLGSVKNTLLSGIGLEEISKTWGNYSNEIYKFMIPFAAELQEFIHIRLADKFDIYFPKDGKQPSIEEAIVWSCAKINDERVTEWYMRMFGWAKEEKEEIVEAGFEKIPHSFGNGSSSSSSSEGASNPKAIINFGKSESRSMSSHSSTAATSSSSMSHSGGTVMNFTEEVSPEFMKNFWDEFRKIASNPVGRVLLYRILIEVRRSSFYTRKASGENIGLRLNCRCINVIKSNKSSFNLEGGSICLNFDSNKTINAVISETENCFMINPKTRPNDVGLFHEFLHWYHALSDVQRYKNERYAGAAKTLLTSSAGKYLYKNLSGSEIQERIEKSAEQWLVMHNGKEVISWEEVRTILGSSTEDPCYQVGDDLSENLYRASKLEFMRFGHKTMSYLEDKDVVKRAVMLCTRVLRNYSSVPFKGVPIGKFGIGNCIFPK